MILDALYRQAKETLRDGGIDGYALDARVLVCHALDMTHEAFILNGQRDVDAAMMTQIDALLAQRLAGRPVAKIIGHKEFYGRDFLTTDDTLDPRPDSETLIETVLGFNGFDAPRILDLGTGTGCLVLTLLAEMPQATGVAVDISDKALAVAQTNASRLGLTARMDFRQGSWFAPIISGEVFDIIISNPPYIPTSDIDGLAREVRVFDPMGALDGGVDGLDPYRIIIAQAGDFLVSGGMLAFEIGIYQAADVMALMTAQGFQDVRAVPDLAGIDRVICGIYR